MLWKIYARQGDHGTEFARECYQNGVIAVGWSAIGDLNAITSWDELREMVAHKWGHEVDHNPRSIGQWAGALWDFKENVKRGHYIVCPDKDAGQYYVGEIQSARAFYDPSPLGMCEFAHRRKVKWSRILNQKQIEAIWPNGQFGGQRTVSTIDAGADRFLKLLKRKHRAFAQGPHFPRQPDMEWGKEAEARAMVWLGERYENPINVAHDNLGWDISCGTDRFEIKGRKSPRTAVVLSENEWRAAKRLKKRYTVLLFTAANKQDLQVAEPIEYCDPASNPESWIEKERITFDYVLREW